MSAKLNQITEGFRAKIARDGGLDVGTLKIDLGDDGCAFIGRSAVENLPEFVFP